MTDIDAIRQREQSVADFNSLYPTGTWVRYWTGTRKDPAKTGQTRTKAQMLSGHTPVVWVTGHGACIALTHVDAIPGQPDDIEDDSHNVPELGGAAERVGEYIYANGDGIYDVIDGHPLYARDLEALRRTADTVWVAGQYKAEMEKLRVELAEVRNQAHRDATNHQQIVRAKNELANERDAMREVVEAAKGVVGAYRAESGPFLIAMARLDAAVSLHDHSCPSCAPGYDCERGIYTREGA